MNLQLKQYAGEVDNLEQNTAIDLLKDFQLVDQPTSIQNNHLKPLQLMQFFKSSPISLQRFLNISVAMAISRRKWKFSCDVEPVDMARTCELLSASWSSISGLSLQVENILTEAAKKGTEGFTVSELRTELDVSPKSMQRF